MKSVPTAQFDYRDFAPEERLPAFRHMTASLYDVWALTDPKDFQAEAYGRKVSDLVFNEVKFSPTRFLRKPEHARGKDRDFLTLHAQMGGEERILMEHGVVRLLTGHIYVRDWSCPYDSSVTAMHLHTIIIPRHRLAASATMSRRSPVVGWSMDAPGGNMLLKLWLQLLESFNTVSTGEAETLCEGFLGFLDGLMRGDTGAERSATLQAMEQYLLSRLQGDVGVEDLRRHFHVSRATIYRLFEPHGGVSAYLGRMRMERAYADLSRADPSNTRIAEIAASWRFIEPSSFSRKFRQQFGLPPSEVLGRDFAMEQPRVEKLIRGVEAFSSYTSWLSAPSDPGA